MIKINTFAFHKQPQMIIGRFCILLFCLFVSISTAQSQQKGSGDSKPPTVFFIGEDEKNYENLVEKYNIMLFSVCDNNMETAFEHWANLLKDIEQYAEKSNLDLKGVKLWLNVFWNKDGKIEHIVFYPKPNSKNLNYDQVKVMLQGFASSYHSPLKHTTGFSHYGSAAFPIMNKSVLGLEK